MKEVDAMLSDYDKMVDGKMADIKGTDMRVHHEMIKAEILAYLERRLTDFRREMTAKYG
jgi:hypothetical protein